MWICQLTWHFPILLDAATAAVARKGDGFLARWADIMTGITHLYYFVNMHFLTQPLTFINNTCNIS